VISDRLEEYTPNEVAMFIREIDSSFNDLASRFLQEVILHFQLNSNDKLFRVGGRWQGSSSVVHRYINAIHGLETWTIA